MFVINKTLKRIWHKHDLVISSLVGSGHTDKYSHEHSSGYGNLLGKIISIKRNHRDFFGYFFQLGMSLLRYLGQLYFRRNYFFTLFTQQLLFRSNYFFWAAVFLEELRFRNCIFLVAVIFSECLLFKAKLLPSSHLLRIGYLLGQLLFGRATFLPDKLFRINISAEEILFRSKYFCTA